MKTNIFQSGSAGFNAMIDLNKKLHQSDVSFCVKNVDLIYLIVHEGKTIETDGCKLLLDALKLVGTGRRDRIPNYRGISQLGPD
jgi:hypothetical protein